MSWTPIVVGVDQSPQAAAAAAFAWELAQIAKAECYFVHGTRPMFTSTAAVESVADVDALLGQQVDAARMGVAAALERVLPLPKRLAGSRSGWVAAQRSSRRSPTNAGRR